MTTFETYDATFTFEDGIGLTIKCRGVETRLSRKETLALDHWLNGELMFAEMVERRNRKMNDAK